MRHQKPRPREADQSMDGLVQWRLRRLKRAGFEARLAERLSSDRRLDLHAVLELIDRGCPPALAARILAPLDEEPEQPR
ncbi:MAG: hypothetical protein KGL16_07410 [Acidobacteriota bacterium]|nr:hypothetical protein [Acidobacteriota bacterium]